MSPAILGDLLRTELGLRRGDRQRRPGHGRGPHPRRPRRDRRPRPRRRLRPALPGHEQHRRRPVRDRARSRDDGRSANGFARRPTGCWPWPTTCAAEPVPNGAVDGLRPRVASRPADPTPSTSNRRLSSWRTDPPRLRHRRAPAGPAELRRRTDPVGPAGHPVRDRRDGGPAAPDLPRSSARRSLVVGQDIHRHAFARAAVDRLRPSTRQVLVVDMGWPSPDRRYADVATFGASALMGRALLTSSLHLDVRTSGR